MKLTGGRADSREVYLEISRRVNESMCGKEPVKSVDLIVDEKDAQEQYDSMEVVIPSKILKGIELKRELDCSDCYYWQVGCRCEDLMAAGCIPEPIDKSKRIKVIPEEKWLQIQNLIKRFDFMEKELILSYRNKAEFYDKLRKVVSDVK